MFTDPTPPGPNPAFAAAEAKFEADNAAMIAEAAKIQEEDLVNQGADRENYIKRLGELAKMKLPPFALILLYMYSLGASSSGATLEGTMNDQIGLTGDRIVLHSTVTSVGNDLTNMINSNDSGSTDGKSDMIVFTDDAEKFLGEISGDSSLPHYDKDLDPNIANPSMNPDAEKLVASEWLDIRRQFDIPNGSTHYNPQGSDTYYFTPGGGAGYIGSFAEYQTDLNTRDDTATAVAKIFTDDSQTASEATNNAQASLNNDIKTMTAVMQSLNQAISGISQMWTTLVKSANSHMASGT